MEYSLRLEGKMASRGCPLEVKPLHVRLLVGARCEGLGPDLEFCHNPASIFHDAHHLGVPGCERDRQPIGSAKVW